MRQALLGHVFDFLLNGLVVVVVAYSFTAHVIFRWIKAMGSLGAQMYIYTHETYIYTRCSRLYFPTVVQKVSLRRGGKLNYLYNYCGWEVTTRQGLMDKLARG